MAKKSDERKHLHQQKLKSAFDLYSKRANQGIIVNIPEILEIFELEITVKRFQFLRKEACIPSARSRHKTIFDKIASLLEDGKKVIEIAKETGIPENRIRGACHAKGVYIKGPNCSDELMSKIVDLYTKKKLPIERIAKEVKKSSRFVSGALKKHGVKIRTNSETSIIYANLKTAFFNDIDNIYKAEVLGFVYADGSISSGRALVISQDEAERELLYIIAERFNYTGKLTVSKKNRSTRSQYILSITHPSLIEDLRKSGMTSKKEDDLSFPFDAVPEALWPSFIRGFFWGDGGYSISVYCNKKWNRITANLCFTSTWQMCVDLKIIFEKQFPNEKFCIYQEGEKNAYRLCASGGTKASVIISKWMFADRTDFVHKSKWDKFSMIADYLRRKDAENLITKNPKHDSNRMRLLLRKIIKEKFENNATIAANKLGLANTFLQNILTGQVSAGYTTKCALSKHLGFTIDDAIDYALLESQKLIDSHILRYDYSTGMNKKWQVNRYGYISDKI